jgi:hypothetical protein
VSFSREEGGMRRVCVVAVLGMVAFWLGAGASASGGGSTFDFHRRWLAPGERVFGRTQFGEGGQGQGRVSDGPYFAYLVRGDRFIEPPSIPRDAVRLGTVRMHRLGGGIWEASIRFVVPNVRPGTYTVSLCNDPCRNAYVGDLMGAWISIAASVGQAKIRNLEARIEERIGQQMSDTTSGLQQDLDLLRETVAAQQSRSISVATDLRLSSLEDQVKAMSTQVRQLRGRADQGLTAWLWLVGWLVAGSTAAAWWRSRRGRPRSGRKQLGRGGLEEAELESVVGPVNLDHVAVADLA